MTHQDFTGRSISRNARFWVGCCTQLLFELCRCQVAEAGVRSNLVVLTPELLDRDLRIDSVSEPLHAQALVAELAVEGLIVAVLPRLTGGAMCAVPIFALRSQADAGLEFRASQEDCWHF